MSAVALGGGREPGQVLRWTAAALLVAGVHAGAGWWLVGHAFAPPPPPEGIAGVTMELEPVAAPEVPTAEPKPMETTGPGPDKQVAEAPETPQPAADQPQVAVAEPPPPVEPPPPAPEPPPVEAAAPPLPEPPLPAPQQKADPAPPPPTPIPDVAPPPSPVPSDAVLAPQPPQPVPPPKKVAVQKPPKPVKPLPPKPDPREVARQEAREAEAEARQAAREQARREARAQAAADARAQRRAARAAAAREGGGIDRESAAPAPVPAASGAALSAWRGEVQAHMNGYTPSSPNGASGTVKVAFAVDRGGRITSASVSSSSGDAELDRAALAAVRRASPVPAPPSGQIPGVIVPVHFR